MSEIRTVLELEAKLMGVSILFEEIVPMAAREWMERIAESQGNCRDMLLLVHLAYWKKIT